jgi:hypothetical protein
MQLERRVYTMGLLLGFGLAGFMGGCGAGTPSPPNAADEARIKSIIGGAHKQQQKEKKERKSNVASKGAMKKRRKGGP